MTTFVKLVASITVPLAVGVLSGFATARGVAEWYPTLAKPAFTPPSWVFGPVWTLLYLMMGFAAFLVWQWGIGADGVRIALAAFLVQLALNGLWSVLFFGMRAPGAALIDIVLLWLAIAVTAWLFWRVVHVAGVLMLPYLAWVTFAAALNGAIWSLNR